MRYVGIDLSTKTGIVIIREDGFIETQEEITHKCDTAESMMKMIHEVTEKIQPDDIVMIEGFGFASKQGFLLGGIGWGVRMELAKMGIPFFLAAPSAVKKFGAGKGNADKRELAVKVNARWGFFHKSDNVTDAFVLAHMARARATDEGYTKEQLKVIQKIG